ncbi:MAG TPA: hypothetical protein VGL93_24310 [Streptosporangiaceae bacterium]|jgi:hypothetical protein
MERRTSDAAPPRARVASATTSWPHTSACPVSGRNSVASPRVAPNRLFRPAAVIAYGVSRMSVLR